MMNIIILDTNIYRQLGSAFFDHVDYIGLTDYCYSSGSEILFINTVFHEYLDYYTKEVLDKNISDIQRGYEKLKRLSEFKKVRCPNFSRHREEELKFIKSKLIERRLKPELDSLLNEQYLLGFLLANKQESKKDNTRDFLIWINALAASIEYSKDQVIIISDDKIFEDNTYFHQLREKLKVKPIKIFKSISNFLSLYGFKSDSLTNELIFKSIPETRIRKIILREKDSFPSYISRMYYHQSSKFKLEEFSIEEIKIQEFYSHRVIGTQTVKIIAHVKVKVNMIYEPEKNIDALLKHLFESKKDPNRLMETFDTSGRPIYHNWILFLFELTYSEDTNTIIKSKFLDFFPERYEFSLDDITTYDY